MSENEGTTHTSRASADVEGIEPLQSHDVGYSRLPTKKGVFWTLMFLGSPTTFLAMLTARYALRDPSCQYSGARIALEVCAFISFAVSGLITWLAWRHWRGDHLEWPNDSAEPPARDRFMAVVCFTLALWGVACALALWAPSFFFNACDTQ